MVCPNDWEVRHPQEVLHDARTDKQSVPDVRPRPDYHYPGFYNTVDGPPVANTTDSPKIIHDWEIIADYDDIVIDDDTIMGP